MAGKTDDLATLSKLDEEVLMNELKIRYREDKIYVSFLFVLKVDLYLYLKVTYAVCVAL